MDSGRRHQTLGSTTKDFTAHGIASSVSIILVPQVPQSMVRQNMDVNGYYANSGCTLKLRNTVLGEPPLYNK